MKIKESTKQKAKSRFYEKTNGFEMLTDFIGWDEPILIRCNECGHTFERKYQIIRYKNGLSCPKCRHEATEAKRLTSEREAREARNKQFAIDEEERRRKVVAERCKGFSYVGNYTGSEGTADIQCNTCGAILTRSWITIRHIGGKSANVRCDNCERIAREQRQREREREREAERIRVNVREQFVRDARKLKRQTQVTMRKCSECESLFFTANAYQKFCSLECQQRSMNRKSKDKRLRKIKERYIDSNITWQKLYEKEHGICYLCGKPVDINDYEYRGETFIAGNNYPSIDHVVALSKGGTHSWDNVRLAHRLCNSLKH